MATTFSLHSSSTDERAGLRRAAAVCGLALLTLAAPAPTHSDGPNLVVSPARRSITLWSDHAERTRPGDVVTLSGQVAPVGRAWDYRLTVRHPDGSLEYDDDRLRTDKGGAYRVSIRVREPGHIRVRVSVSDRSGYRDAEAERIIPIAPEVGMAVVVRGASSDADAAQSLSDLAVGAFRSIGLSDVRCPRRLWCPDDRRVTDHRIWYLHPDTRHDLDGDGRSDVDGLPTLKSLTSVLTDWAAARVMTRDYAGALDAEAVRSTPLTLYLVGDASSHGLRLNDTETLTPAALAAMLDDLDRAVAEVFLAAGAAPPEHVPVTVIVEAPSSGSFIPHLSGPQRIVITSTEAGGPSMLSPEWSFSYPFLSRIRAGDYVHAAFESAFLQVVTSGFGQVPQIEATGNGVSNEMIDEIVASTALLEERQDDTRPVIRNAAGMVTLRDVPAMLLWAYVEDPEGDPITVEATLVPPSNSFEPTRVVPLQWVSDDRWEAVAVGFVGLGTYTIVYTAHSSDAARSLAKSVEVEDNTPPLAPTNLHLSQVADDTVVLQWLPSEALDTQGYRIYVTAPGGSETLLADAGNVDRCTVTGVVSPGTWSFRVTAYDRVPYESAGASVSLKR